MAATRAGDPVSTEDVLDMRVTYSEQYNIPCVILPDMATAQDVIDHCQTVGATINHDGEEFCVTLRADVGRELWTESALRRSLTDEADHGRKASPMIPP